MLCALMAGWNEADPSGEGLTVAEAFQRAGRLNEDGEPIYPTLANVLLSMPRHPDPNRVVGNFLAAKETTVIGNQQFINPRRSHNAKVWVVKTIENEQLWSK
jgi:hypothetical protein